jgi:hypothetical protein
MRRSFDFTVHDPPVLLAEDIGQDVFHLLLLVTQPAQPRFDNRIREFHESAAGEFLYMT